MARKKKAGGRTSGIGGSAESAAAAPGTASDAATGTAAGTTAGTAAGKALPGVTAPPAGSGTKHGAPPAMRAMPAEVPGPVPLVLAAMMFLAPAVGMPNEELLQDTLKSAVVAFAALAAGLLFFFGQRARSAPLRWHSVAWLPLALLAWALGSITWSHAALASVEAIRWFLFFLILWLALQTLSRERMPFLASSIHWGAVIASFWTASQFWVNFAVFPQGPNPASTFVNRNFFAEFAICTVPFSLLALAHARSTPRIAILALATGFNLVAILMTGTRSALGAMLVLLFVVPVIFFLYRDRLPMGGWTERQKVVAGATLVLSVFCLGLVPTGNAQLLKEHETEGRGLTPLARGLARVASMTERKEYTERSFSIRMVMWKATGRMIAAHPLAGVGAGAWEVDIPLYQTSDSQLETDYYAHNEFLQLLAEYGIVGWLFLLALFAYLLWAAWATWRDRRPQAQDEAPLRALLLASLLALLIVSNAGFPWRLASTGALFALCLGALAASDVRLGHGGRLLAAPLDWRPLFSRAMVPVLLACTMLAAYITQQAILCESKIVRAVKLALTVSQYGGNDVNNPRWNQSKAEMLQLVREGIAINPHYRKITPMVADELARWGDWGNAIWIWDSVAQSRPYVIALIGNIGRGYLQQGQPEKALQYLERARRIQPDAPAVRSLEVIYRIATGREAEAAQLVRRYLAAGPVDDDLLRAGYRIGIRTKDYPLALQVLQQHLRTRPDDAVEALLRIADLYTKPDFLDEAKALEAYRGALAAVPERDKGAIRQQIPTRYLDRL